MAKITIEELSKSLKDHLNDLGLTEAQVQQLIDKFEDEKIGDITKLNTSNKSSLVAAINELFQSANNGKQLIANAIGEPLSSNDTFSAMSSDINGLLATFKTNMMNNGITVESTDKFKSLIDKIATLADSEGKGVQIANGITKTALASKSFSHAVESKTSSYSYIEIRDLTFTPQVILAFVKYGVNSNSVFTIYNTFSMFPERVYLFSGQPGGTAGGSVQATIHANSCNIDSTGFTIPINTYNTTSEDCYWVAIGVGEEDTTLRDTLAGILEDEGVTVTEEDDMASLIGKVDSEFDRKNANSGLDIISATELPATGKENQICVITNNPVDNILLTSSVNDMITDGINIYLGNSSSGDISMGSLVPVYANGITTNYYFNRIYQGNNRLASYWYMNNSWKQLTNEYIPVFEDGSIITTELLTGLSMYGASVTDGAIVIDASANSSYYSVYSKNAINFTDISKIEIVLKMNYVYGASQLKMYAASTDNPDSSNVTTISNTAKTITSTNYTTWTINTSTWTGTHYFIIRKYNEYSGLCCYIQSIRFY